MLLLGLLLIGATAAFAGLLIAYNLSGGPTYTVMMFGNSLGTLNALEIFLAGLALALLFGLGLAMTASSAARHRRRAARLRQARREADRAAAERDALAARLDETGTEPTAAEPAGTPSAAPRGRHRLHLFGH